MAWDLDNPQGARGTKTDQSVEDDDDDYDDDDDDGDDDDDDDDDQLHHQQQHHCHHGCHTFGKSFLASSPRKVIVNTVVIPNKRQ